MKDFTVSTNTRESCNTSIIRSRPTSLFTLKIRYSSPRDDDLIEMQRTLQLQQQARVIHELPTPQSRIMHKQRTNIGTTTAYVCTCYRKHTIKRVLKRPFFWTQATLHTHTHGCPFWSAGGLRTNITFGIILCYLALGLQWRMILTLSIDTGPMSILPGWRCYRAVEVSSSPAFQAINTILSSAINAQTISNLFRDLFEIFDTRRASVDDRLQSGRTLLHVSFSSNSLRYTMVQQLADCDKYSCENLGKRV